MMHYAAALCMSNLLSYSLRCSWRHQQRKGSHREAVELSTPSSNDSMQYMKCKRAQQKQTPDVRHMRKHDTFCNSSVHVSISFWLCFFEMTGTGGKALNQVSETSWMLACTKKAAQFHTHLPNKTKVMKRTRLRQQLLANPTSGNQTTSTTEQSQR